MNERKKILIVDPDRTTAENMKAILRGDEFDADVFTDGSQALESCKRRLPDFVILEGLIPKLPGLDLARRIRQLEGGGQVPLLLVSGMYSGSKFTTAVHEAGIDGTLAKPFKAEELLHKVHFLMGKETSIVKMQLKKEKPFSHSGDLKETPFIRIVFNLSSKKESGTLRLEFGNSKKLITFESGEPRLVVSNLEKECLGQILVRKGRLTAEECQHSIEMMSSLKKRQGETLIQLGLMEPYELDEALKQQAREKFCEIFSWREGKYIFVPGKVFKKDLTPVDLSVPQLCLRGVREHYSLPQLQQELRAYLHAKPVIRNQPFRLEDYKLATWDLKIARHLQVGKSLAEILVLKAARDVDAYHLIYTLASLETISLMAITPVKQAERQTLVVKEKPKPLAMPEGTSPFEMLGVNESATDIEIRKAYESKLAALGNVDPNSEPMRSLRRALEIIGTLQGRRDYLIRIYQDKGTLPVSARDVFQPRELLQIGKQFLEKKEFTRAIQVFDDGMQMFREDGLMYAHYGFASIQGAHVSGVVGKSDFDKWKRLVIRGTQLSPKEAETHYLMGRVFSLEQDYDKALKAYRQSLECNKAFHPAAAELRVVEKRVQKKEVSGVSFIKWKE